MLSLKKLNTNSFFIGLQFILSVIFLLPYFLKHPILYGEAQFFSSWELWLEKTGSTWLNLGLGAPIAQGIGNNFPVLYIWSFLERTGLSFGTVQFFWYFALFFLPFLFFYLLSARVFRLRPFQSFLVACFYIYNPIFLNYWLNLNPWLMPAYYLMPLFWLIIGANWRDNRKTFAFSAIAFFFSLYIFANPPYLVVFLLSLPVALLFFAIYFEEKIFSFFLLRKALALFAALFVVANFIITGLFLNYQYSLSNYAEGVNPVSVLEANSKWAQLENIFIFRHQFFNESAFSFLHGLMNSHLLYGVFIIPLFLIFLVLLAKKREKPVLFLLVSIIVTLFFIKGLNPPFSPAFLYLFERVPLFNMFKTASEKFSPLYVFLVALSLGFLLRNDSHRVQKVTARLLCVWLIVMALPVYSFHLISDIRHLEVKITHFYSADFIGKTIHYLNEDKENANTLSLPGSRSYLVHLSPEKGAEYYLGLDPVMNNLKMTALESYLDSPVTKTAYESLLNGTYAETLPFFGVKYLVLNKMMLAGFGFYREADSNHYQEILKNIPYTAIGNDAVRVYKNNNYLPKFYFAERVLFVEGKNDQLSKVLAETGYDLKTVAAFSEENTGKSTSDASQGEYLFGAAADNGVVEFKKVSSTKYRVVLHDVKGSVPLVFLENFHKDWKIFPASSLSSAAESKSFQPTDKIFSTRNEPEFASEEDIRLYLAKGWLTQILSKTAFISKMQHRTIQNDGLQEGPTWETWRKGPLIEEAQHLKVNAFANSWIIDADKICQEHPESCRVDETGLYDIEVIVEFSQQRTFYFGLMASSAAALLAFGYLVWKYVRPGLTVKK